MISTDARNLAADGDEGMLFADGFDAAIVGRAYVWTAEGRTTVALYDYDECVRILVRGGSTVEEAEEHLETNTLGAYVGPRTPAFASFTRPRRRHS